MSQYASDGLCSTTELHVVDKVTNMPCPVGVPGELIIAGIGISNRGYLNRPEKTSASFVRNAYSADPKYANAYRTGDLVRWTIDGNVDYLGRIDRQVKLRGLRIELGEIESLVSKAPRVAAAYVTVSKEHQLLVAFCTPENVDGEAVRTAVGKSVPSYMVPAKVVSLASFPLTTNGKVDYKKLPMPELSSTCSAEYIEPKGDVEKTIADVFASSLGVEKVSVVASFFDIGGHSLKAMRAAHAITDLGFPVKVGDIFAHPSVQALTAYIQGTVATAANVLPPVERNDESEGPLSFSQARLFFMDRLSGGRDASQHVTCPSLLRKYRRKSPWRCICRPNRATPSLAYILWNRRKRERMPAGPG